MGIAPPFVMWHGKKTETQFLRNYFDWLGILLPTDGNKNLTVKQNDDKDLTVTQKLW